MSTLPLLVYRLLVRALTPAIRLHIHVRARAGKEDPARLMEREGVASKPAFDKDPIWLHAASVGEAVAALTVVQIFRDQGSTAPILITTGTVTSAHVVTARLPSNAVHQFAPLDHPRWITRFLDYWHPAAAIRLESEIWPVTLTQIKNRGIPLALVNARLSPRSFSRWRLFPKTIRKILSSFDMILADGRESAERFQHLGAMNVTAHPSIKFLSPTPEIDSKKQTELIQIIGKRPVWLYASTHAGEETLAAQIHRDLKTILPDLLTILVPRHPERRGLVASALRPYALNTAFRSRGQSCAPETDLYIADTMGELMLFYAVCPVAVIGRSFSLDGGGGHNPIEAAIMGCYPLSGPHVQNLDTIFDAMIAGHAAEILTTPEILASRLRHLLTHPNELDQARETARDFVAKTRERTYTHLAENLKSFLQRGAP